jgi:pimeloyl-ACP methyl ester carboxylesterase
MAVLELKDGRKLDYISNDVSNKAAILFHHGTPGDCSVWQKWFKDVTDVLAIAASRPGYGFSDRNKGRTVASDLFDQNQLLEKFAVEKFVSIGWSGGGPHSLGMSRNPECQGVITLAGVGEWGNSEFRFSPKAWVRKITKNLVPLLKEKRR